MARSERPPQSQDRRRWSRTGYLPSLDGWRALAILGVIMDHDDPWVMFGRSNASFHTYGGWGVFLFFAISGFLVCTRILEDESLRGRFELRNFYIRRLFRIQPAALVYLSVIAVLSALGITHERSSALLSSLFLYSNYLYNAADHTGRWFLTGQFWTLAVEEHFYLVLSLLLFFVRRRRELLFAGVIAGLCVWTRLVIHFALYTEARQSEFLLLYLMFPALMAVALRRKAVLDFAVRFLRPWTAFFLTFVFKQVWFSLHPIGPQAHPVLSWLLSAPPLLFLCFGFWVIATSLHPRSWTTRLLEAAPLRFLGRLSYSVYLWQGLFLSAGAVEARVHSPALLLLTTRPWRYVAILTCSLLSYYFVERPLVRLGHRLAPPATPGHADSENAHLPSQGTHAQKAPAYAGK